MQTYRIVKTVRGSSRRSSVWFVKSTDEDAVLAATALLSRGESAEVWGERQFVARVDAPSRRRFSPAARLRGLALPLIRRVFPARALPRPIPGRGGVFGVNLMARCVLAGLIMTTGIALVFAALYDERHRGFAGPAQVQPPAAFAVVPAAEASPQLVEEVRDVEDAGPEEVPNPADPSAPMEGKAKAHRTRARAQIASHTRGHERLFPASNRVRTNVYDLFGSDGFAQGGR